ncbi:hypothetical protein PCL_12086 [Purpureocillium lilacinum]|uniref:Uncharacterized protein n=1 Tax=Purpureocillium lilacinum TaxID=33203 RepID=A0A2U3DPJ4_PURLI|nr:hypothetical protein PCL_12086 [Purpureocillium lilacinum]
MNHDGGSSILGKHVLIHEYTRALGRRTSACVTDVTSHWRRDATALYETLDLPLRDEDCLLLEMSSTIEPYKHDKFPLGCELTGSFVITIAKPALQEHRWRCVTRMSRPAELQDDGTTAGVYIDVSSIPLRHCGNMEDGCDCNICTQLNIRVPFPAVEWASILSIAMQYPDTSHQDINDKFHFNSDSEQEPAGQTRKRGSFPNDGHHAGSRALGSTTSNDLISLVGMYQELWSCAPESAQWTRQAIVFWRFKTTKQRNKSHPIFIPAGTTWRWLTINDPVSHYHQQAALLNPATSDLSDADAGSLPTPLVTQNLMAPMDDTFGAQHNRVARNIAPLPGLETSLSLREPFSHSLTVPWALEGTSIVDLKSNIFDAIAGANVAPPTVTGTTADVRLPYLSHSQASSSGQTAFGGNWHVNTSVDTYMRTTEVLDSPNQIVPNTALGKRTTIAPWDFEPLDIRATPTWPHGGQDSGALSTPETLPEPNYGFRGYEQFPVPLDTFDRLSGIDWWPTDSHNRAVGFSHLEASESVAGQ